MKFVNTRDDTVSGGDTAISLHTPVPGTKSSMRSSSSGAVGVFLAKNILNLEFWQHFCHTGPSFASQIVSHTLCVWRLITRKHSRRMHTACLLTEKDGGWCCLGGVAVHNRKWHHNTPPPGQNDWHTLLKIIPCPKFHLRAITMLCAHLTVWSTQKASWPSFCRWRHLPVEKVKQIFLAFLHELRPLFVHFCAVNSMNPFWSYTTMYFPPNCYFSECLILGLFSLFRSFNNLDLCQATQLLLYFKWERYEFKPKIWYTWYPSCIL